VDYWRAKPGPDARKLDWQATWRNWMRKTGSSHYQRQGYAAGSQIGAGTKRMMDAQALAAKFAEEDQAETKQ